VTVCRAGSGSTLNPLLASAGPSLPGGSVRIDDLGVTGILECRWRHRSGWQTHHPSRGLSASDPPAAGPWRAGSWRSR
jgi:hypothetical protein